MTEEQQLFILTDVHEISVSQISYHSYHDHMITDFGNQPIGEGHSDRPSHVGGTDTEKIGQPSLMGQNVEFRKICQIESRFKGEIRRL